MKMTIRGDYFDGEYHSPKSDEVINKKAPSELNIELWQAHVDYSHIDQVVQSASSGYKKWRLTSLDERISLLNKYKEIVLSKKDEIAHAIAWETGKPLWETFTEAAAVAAKVDVTINESLKRIQTQTINEVLPNLDGHVYFKPLGPTLIIGPYNFPCHLANGQILSSLIAGNTIIFKPSEKTIFSSQLLIDCFHEAGFPAGVINFINGSAKTSSDLVSHPSIKGVFFTGSYGVGRKILEATHTDMSKMVALEMGGRNSTIINDYNDEEHVISELIRSAYLSTGQRCTSTSIVFVKNSLFDKVTDEFHKISQKILVDHPVKFKADPFMGPLVDDIAFKANKNFHEFTLKHGAQALIPFESLDIGYEGYYASPGLYKFEKTPEKSFFEPEIFGPQISFIPYDDFDQAIELANATPYGLAASLFTQDPKLYQVAYRDIEAGIFNLNRSTVGASSKLPFGGVKNSGNFRPAAVSMIDHCVSTMASLETMSGNSKLETIKGLK